MSPTQPEESEPSAESLMEQVLAEQRLLLEQLEQAREVAQLQNQELREVQRELEELLRHKDEIYDHSPIGHASLDSHGTIHETNLTCANLLGVERGQLIGDTVLVFVEKGDRPQFRGAMARCLESKVVHTETRLTRCDGTPMVAEFIMYPAPPAADPPQFCRCTITDITRRKLAETELLKTKATLQAAMDNCQSAIIIADAQERVQYLNDVALKYIGRSRAEVRYGLTYGEFFAGLAMRHHDGSAFREEDCSLLQAIRTSKNCSSEFILCAPGQQERILISSAAPILGEGGEQIAGIVALFDITESKRHEFALLKAHDALEEQVRQRTAQLEASQAMYRVVADNTYTFEYWLSPERRFIYLSPSCECLTGFTVEQFRATPRLFERHVHPEDRRAFRRNLLKALRDATAEEFEFRFVHRDGTLRWMEHVGRPIFEGKAFRGLRGSIRDTTSQKEAEARLVASRDQLAAMATEINRTEERARRHIARQLHDQVVQNLALGTIKLELAVKSGELPRCESVRELSDILKASIADLRSLSFDLSPPVLYEVGLKAAIGSLGGRLAREHSFTFRFPDEHDEPQLGEDLKVTLYQVARELLINTVKHAHAATVTVQVALKGERVRLSVRDDGAGFAMGSRREGFGLASIRQRVQFLGGTLQIGSAPGRGTSIEVIVPVRTAQQTQNSMERGTL